MSKTILKFEAPTKEILQIKGKLEKLLENKPMYLVSDGKGTWELQVPASEYAVAHRRIQRKYKSLKLKNSRLL